MNIDILFKAMPTIKFLANRQDRFEPGKVFPTNYIHRLIILEYSPLGNEVTITIDGFMKPKKAMIVSDINNILTYQDISNPGFKYEVETNPKDNTIVRVSVKVSFPMTVEYRYSI